MNANTNDTPVYTIGHSTRTIEEFVTILRAGAVTRVIDVRSVPRSRTNPQYNLDRLPDELAAYQIRHQYIAELGGLRGRTATIAPDINAIWQNKSFHNYADYALTPAFHEGLDRLVEVADRDRCAIMCAEAVWWRCHRRIIADYLISAGRPVLHLLSATKVEPARLTPGAKVDGDRVRYPRPEASHE